MRYFEITESAVTIPNWLKRDMYHGTARQRLDFRPIAYFTPDPESAWKNAELDGEIDAERRW